MFAQTKILTSTHWGTSVIVVFLIALTPLLGPVQGQNDPDRRVLVDLPALPESFTNDKLPATGPSEGTVGKEKCFSMMGCYEEIPITNIPQNPLTMRTEFRLYYKDTETVVQFGRYENCLKGKPQECEYYPFNLEALHDSPFVPSRRTIVVIGGYMSKAPSSWEISLKDLWSQLDDVNVILLCWTGGNSGLYQTAAANTRPVARQLTVLLYYLAKLKGGPEVDLDLSDDAFTEKFYLIGHSLGAHIAGFVGQDLAGRVGRITGLDPAGPSFDVLDRRFRVDRSDAQLVDIMHTNAGSRIFTTQTQYGSALSSGHFDLWANDGVHQPGCTNDMLGCSHKRANKYYEAFLNHQLSMRHFLLGKAGGSAAAAVADDIDRPLYRLAAYAGDSFDEFHNGTSLMRRCPITALDDADLSSSDLDACSIPIDYVSWFDTLRHELHTRHGLDFGAITSHSSSPVPRNFYFYTSAETADQMDHFLVRIRVSKAAYGKRAAEFGGSSSGSVVAETDDGKPSQLDKVNGHFERGGCDVAFDLEMSDGDETSYKIKRYRLLDRLDHMEIVFPFLSADILSKYELAKLDAGDFFVERKSDKDFIAPDDMDHLRAALVKIFPSLITVRGFDNGEQSGGGGKKKNGGILNSIARLFSRSKKGDSEQGSLDHANCQLAIESFSVQPLRKFHRHLSAVFTRDCQREPKRPLNVVLLDANEPSSKIDLLNEAADATSCKDRLEEILPKLTLNSVIIGPRDASSELGPAGDVKPASVDPPNDDFGTEESRVELTLSSAENLDTGEPTRPGSATRSRAYLWLILTLVLLLCMLIIVLVSMLVASRPASEPAVTLTNPNHQCAFALPDIRLGS